MTEINGAFNWVCQPAAERLFLEVLKKGMAHSSYLSTLSLQLKKQSSTELLAWVDHVAIRDESKTRASLEKAGLTMISNEHNTALFRHLGAKLPDFALIPEDKTVIALSVDSIADFLMVRGQEAQIKGTPFSPYRTCLVSEENGVEVWAVERRGTETLTPIVEKSEALSDYLNAKEKWMKRPRSLEHEEKDFKVALNIAEEIEETLGADRAACLVLECERAYWQNRNVAAEVQKNRQDRLGMGWANHDHHTFRSSRSHFTKLVKLFEILGFKCRERFYAGEEAGWGAQVMENERAKLVLFLDVDLSPEEIVIDFAHHPLPERHHLGTIGLWCALHGDSILKAGMHHLEAQFEFEHLTEDLKSVGIGMMDPFSNFPYLKQAFTRGETWSVDKARVEKLLAEKKITKAEAEKFLTSGAVGSHMENLQRKEGYKGFNQKNVSFIIKKTDPRNVPSSAGA